MSDEQSQVFRVGLRSGQVMEVTASYDARRGGWVVGHRDRPDDVKPTAYLAVVHRTIGDGLDVVEIREPGTQTSGELASEAFLRAQAMQEDLVNDAWGEVDRQRGVLAARERQIVETEAARHRLAELLDIDPAPAWDDLVTAVMAMRVHVYESEAARGRLATLLDAVVSRNDTDASSTWPILAAQTNVATVWLCALRRAVEGRAAPPTDAEVALHDAVGGLWRCVVPDNRALSVDGMRGSTVRFHAAQVEACGETATWWALDASLRPVPAPAPDDASLATREDGTARLRERITELSRACDELNDARNVLTDAVVSTSRERDRARAVLADVVKFLREEAERHDPGPCHGPDGPGAGPECPTRPTLTSATFFGTVHTCEAHRSLHRVTPHQSHHADIMRLLDACRAIETPNTEASE